MEGHCIDGQGKNTCVERQRERKRKKDRKKRKRIILAISQISFFPSFCMWHLFNVFYRRIWRETKTKWDGRAFIRVEVKVEGVSERLGVRGDRDDIGMT